MTLRAAGTLFVTCLVLTSSLAFAQDNSADIFDEIDGSRNFTLVATNVEVIIVFDLDNARRDLEELLRAFPELLPPEPGDYLRNDAVKLALRPDVRGNQKALEQLMQELRQSTSLRGVNPVYVGGRGEPIYLDNAVRVQLNGETTEDAFLQNARNEGIELLFSHIENELNHTLVYQVPRDLDVIAVARILNDFTTTAFARPVLISSVGFAAPDGVTVNTAPNPCSQQALITYSVEYGGPLSLSVHRMDGTRLLQIVDSPDHPRGMSRHEIDVSQWPAGVYMVHLETPYDGRTSKFVIAR